MICLAFLLLPGKSFAGAPALLLHHAIGDVRSTFFSWPAAVVAGGAAAAWISSSFDEEVKNHFRGGRDLGKADTVADFVGKPYVWDSAALGVFGIGRLAHKETLAFTGENLVEALAFTEAMTGGLKLGFRRDRSNGGSYSFPSGHAARTFAAAAVLETLHGPAAGIPAFLAAGFISYSRLDANEHHVSDVVFGAALGSAIGWGTTRFHKSENPKWALAPLSGEAKGIQFFSLW